MKFGFFMEYALARGAAVWRGLLTAEKSAASPSFSVELNGVVVEGTRISAGPSDREWVIDIPIPKHAIGYGVYALLFLSRVIRFQRAAFASRQAVHGI